MIDHNLINFYTVVVKEKREVKIMSKTLYSILVIISGKKLSIFLRLIIKFQIL